MNRFAAAALVASLLLAGCQAKPPHVAAPVIPAAPGLAARSAAANQAADKLVAMAQGYATNGRAPRQSDPAVGPLLDAVLDTSPIPAFAGAPADVQAFDAWQGAVLKVLRVYAMAGTGVTDAPKPSAAEVAQSQRNLVTYAPEMGRILDTQVVLASRQGATMYYIAITSHFDEDRRTAILQSLQPAVEQAYRNSLGMVGDKVTSSAWKLARIKVLIATAPRIWSILSIARQLTMQKDARDIAAQSDDPAVKAALEQFATLIGPRP